MALDFTYGNYLDVKSIAENNKEFDVYKISSEVREASLHISTSYIKEILEQLVEERFLDKEGDTYSLTDYDTFNDVEFYNVFYYIKNVLKEKGSDYVFTLSEIISNCDELEKEENAYHIVDYLVLTGMLQYEDGKEVIFSIDSHIRSNAVKGLDNYKLVHHT